MGRWLLLVSLSLFACGNEPDETSTVVADTLARRDSSPNLTETTAVAVADTASYPSYAPPSVKRPSGIYQFVLPYDPDGKILHTIAFYPNGYRLQEEYLDKPDSVVVTEGTWAPSQGMIWLYSGNVVRGRYAWKGDTLQYSSFRLNKKFSLAKLTPATQNQVWQEKKAAGATLYGIGTEPFWSVEVTQNDSVVLSMPDWQAPLRAKLTGTNSVDTGTTYSADADSLQITVLPQFCSDGMSDFVYSQKITIRYKGQTLRGCGAKL